ncbi:MAG: hypothetical protein RL410_1438 [Actinomycetota bacterium]|jgi:hypothetical protein
MTELKLNFARAWVEFDDPEDEENIYRCDLTWLTSRWNCIYGRGCQGIHEGKAENGCCSLGAHFSGREDQKRVQKYVEKLTPEYWQNYELGRANWIEKDEDNEKKTRVVNGGCIFLNSPDFPGGGGCALHNWSAKNDVSITKTKPDVCWQLPIRRDFEWRELEDGSRRYIITIEEYARSGWGPGGHELNWYCTSNTEAHNAPQPVYITEKDTLIAMMSEEAYALLVTFCEARVAAITAARRIAAANGDPKEVKAIMDSIASHPADQF